MFIDIAFVAIVLGIALFGFFRGVFSQAWGVLALVVALGGAEPATEMLEVGLFGPGSAQDLFGGVLIRLGVGFAIYVGMTLLGRLIEYVVIDRLKLLSAGNRFLGGVLGGVKGLVLAATLLFVSQFAVTYVSGGGSYVSHFEQSRVVQILGGYNPLNFIYLNRLKPYLVNEQGHAAKNLPAYLRTPSLEALVQDPSFVSAVERRDLVAILENDRFRYAMANPQTAIQLNELHR